MKISSEIHSAAVMIGEERAIELMAKAGFTGWDFSMFRMISYDWVAGKTICDPHPLNGNDYLAYARRLKQIGLDNGIVCNQSHAPFPIHIPDIYSYLKRAIECTAEAGGEICIIHPDNDKGPEENAEIYHELLPFAKACGIKIATENMFNWDAATDSSSFAACRTAESFVDHLNAVNDDALVACLDIGHAEMKGCGTSAVQLIEALGDKLQALHIHDNDLHHDSHQLPFTMSIDFDRVIKALKKIGYKGWLTLEADTYLEKYTPDTIFEGIRKMADTAKELDRMFRE